MYSGEAIGVLWNAVIGTIPPLVVHCVAVLNWCNCTYTPSLFRLCARKQMKQLFFVRFTAETRNLSLVYVRIRCRGHSASCWINSDVFTSTVKPPGPAADLFVRSTAFLAWCLFHHYHVPEGLGMFPVPWSSRWSWSLHLFLGRPMFLRPFGLCCSACFGILFVSILCTCCSHFSWYCFISFTTFCAPVFCLIHWCDAYLNVGNLYLYMHYCCNLC